MSFGKKIAKLALLLSVISATSANAEQEAYTAQQNGMPMLQLPSNPQFDYDKLYQYPTAPTNGTNNAVNSYYYYQPQYGQYNNYGNQPVYQYVPQNPNQEPSYQQQDNDSYYNNFSNDSSSTQEEYPSYYYF